MIPDKDPGAVSICPTPASRAAIAALSFASIPPFAIPCSMSDRASAVDGCRSAVAHRARYCKRRNGSETQGRDRGSRRRRRTNTHGARVFVRNHLSDIVKQPHWYKTRSLIKMEIRPANLTDIPALLDLINAYARQGIMLPRTEFEMAENIRDFIVASESPGGGRLVGGGALHFYTPFSGEV